MRQVRMVHVESCDMTSYDDTSVNHRRRNHFGAHSQSTVTHIRIGPFKTIIGLIIILQSLLTYVAGGDVFITSPESPDWSDPHSFLPITFFVLTYPIYILSAVLLWKKRFNYPIAGRGAIYLLATNVILLIGSPILTTLTIAYPDGVPCGLVFLAAAMSVLPLSFTYMIRGWILVFKLELQNYMAEVKLLELEAMKRKLAAEQQREEAEADVQRSGSDGDDGLEGDGGGGGGQRKSPMTRVRVRIQQVLPTEETERDTRTGALTATGGVHTTTTTTTSGGDTNSTKLQRQTSLGLRRFRQAEQEAGASSHVTQESTSIIVTRERRGSSMDDGLETIELAAPSRTILPNQVSPSSNNDLASPTNLIPSNRSSSQGNTSSNNVYIHPHNHHTPSHAPSIFHYPTAKPPAIMPILEESGGGRASPYPGSGSKDSHTASGNGNVTRQGDGAGMKYVIVGSNPSPRGSPNPADEADDANQDQRRGSQGKLMFVAPTDANGKSSSSSQPVTPDNKVDLTSVPGHWFLAHRHLIEARWVALFFGLLSTGFFAFAILVFLILDDPDTKLMNDEMFAQGKWKDRDNPYFTGSQLSPNNLLTAAPCMLRNAKMLMIQFCIVGLLAPLVVWIVLRLRSNAARTLALKARGLPEPPAPTGLAHLRAEHPNDTDAVKMELAGVALVATFICAAYPLFSLFAKPYILFDVLLPFAAVEWITLAHPIYVAMRLGRKHRQFLREQRQRSLGTTTGTNDKASSGVVRKLPHHRPYFRLHFILRSAHTYPVLLKFLQKEHSSENALFIKDVRVYEKLCKLLELRIPTWPKAGEDDAGIGGVGVPGGEPVLIPGAGGRQSVIASAKQQHRRFISAVGGTPHLHAANRSPVFTAAPSPFIQPSQIGGTQASRNARASAFLLQQAIMQQQQNQNPNQNPNQNAPSVPGSVIRVEHDDPDEEIAESDVTEALANALRNDATPRVAGMGVGELKQSSFMPGIDEMQLDEGGIVSSTCDMPLTNSGSPNILSAATSPTPGLLASGAASPVEVHASKVGIEFSQFPSGSPVSRPQAPMTNGVHGTPKFRSQNAGAMMRSKDQEDGLGNGGSRIGQSRVGAGLATARPQLTVKPPPTINVTMLSIGTPTHHKTVSSPAVLNGSPTTPTKGGGVYSNAFGGVTQPHPAGPAVSIGAPVYSSQPQPAPSPSHQGHSNSMSTKLHRNMYSPQELRSLHELAREVREMILRIYDSFMRTGSDNEVNIPDDLHSLVSTQVELIRQWYPSAFDHSAGLYLPLTRDSGLPIPPPFALSTLFKQASMTVFELVQKDSFRRFILTDDFLDLLLAADESELLKQQSEVSLEAQTRQVMSEALFQIRVREEEDAGFHGQEVLKEPNRRLRASAACPVPAAGGAGGVDLGPLDDPEYPSSDPDRTDDEEDDTNQRRGAGGGEEPVIDPSTPGGGRRRKSRKSPAVSMRGLPGPRGSRTRQQSKSVHASPAFFGSNGYPPSGGGGGGDSSQVYNFLDAPPMALGAGIGGGTSAGASPHHWTPIDTPLTGGNHTGNNPNRFSHSSAPGSKRGSIDAGIPLHPNTRSHHSPQQTVSPPGERLVNGDMEREIAGNRSRRPPAILTVDGEWTHTPTHLPMPSPGSGGSGMVGGGTGTAGTSTVASAHSKSPLQKPSTARIQSIRRHLRNKVPSTDTTPMNEPRRISRDLEDQAELDLVEM